MARRSPPVRRAVLVLLALAASFSARAASPALERPWPDPGRVSGVRVGTVALASADPFTPADAGRAPSRTVAGRLYLPAGAGPGHRVPAVVLLHGSVGNWEERGFRYGLPLAAMGVAVLVVETYAARPDLGTSFIGRALHITETMFDADAYAALDLLTHRADIDPARVALIGFSYGGMAAAYAATQPIASRFARNGERFAGFATFYAPCIARFDDVRATGAPVLMLYGLRDELVRPDRCGAVAADLERGGSPVTIVAYPEAVHQWDGEMTRRLIGRQLADCDFRVDRAGRVHDRRTGLVMRGPVTRGLILALCTGRRPWPIGRDDAVVARSDRDLGRFLDTVFR